MKKFIGKRMKFLVSGNAVKGVFVAEGTGDESGLVLVKGDDGNVYRVPKSKIELFTYENPADETVEFLPIRILGCRNPPGCQGVFVVLEGAGFKPEDFETFMQPCPCRDVSCKRVFMGDARNAPPGILRKTIVNTVYGEYPKGVKNAAVRTGGEAGVGQGKGGKGVGEEKHTGG